MHHGAVFTTKTHASIKVSMPHLGFQRKYIGQAIDTAGTWILQIKWNGIGFSMILIIAYIEMPTNNNEVYKHVI